MGRAWTAAGLCGAIGAGALLAGADAPAKGRPDGGAGTGKAIVFTIDELDGGVVQGRVQRPEAVYVVPRSESAKQAVESTGDHLQDLLPPKKQP